MDKVSGGVGGKASSLGLGGIGVGMGVGGAVDGSWFRMRPCSAKYHALIASSLL